MSQFHYHANQTVTSDYPTFSIVFETENLATVELNNIYRSLSSLARQVISPETANEFLIIDSGDTPEEVLESLCLSYPWITIKKIPKIDYYEAKMAGASLVTGEVVIFCDSDCEYEPSWLIEILNTFNHDENINVVAGETSTLIRNPYELAIAIHYFFPRYSYYNKLYQSHYYFLNSVAFRRDFLGKNPIPTNIPLYRGNCGIHSYFLSQLKGHSIWRNPRARAIHEPPTISFAFWRYLLMGRDHVIKGYVKQYVLETNDLSFQYLLTQPSFTLWDKLYGITKSAININPIKINKIMHVLAMDPYQLLFLPISIIIALCFELIYTAGRIVTYLRPNFVLNLYKNLHS